MKQAIAIVSIAPLGDPIAVPVLRSPVPPITDPWILVVAGMLSDLYNVGSKMEPPIKHNIFLAFRVRLCV